MDEYVDVDVMMMQMMIMWVGEGGGGRRRRWDGMYSKTRTHTTKSGGKNDTHNLSKTGVCQKAVITMTSGIENCAE